jgi:hypothetical protein
MVRVNEFYPAQTLVVTVTKHFRKHRETGPELQAINVAAVPIVKTP